jgi:hypothetical protein
MRSLQKASSSHQQPSRIVTKRQTHRACLPIRSLSLYLIPGTRQRVGDHVHFQGSAVGCVIGQPIKASYGARGCVRAGKILMPKDGWWCD